MFIPVGMLVYFSNGVLPLLKAFYQSFLNHLSEQKDPRITLDILSALLVSYVWEFKHYKE